MQRPMSKISKRLSNLSQKGLAITLVVVVIAIIAALWLSSKHGNIMGYFKNKEIAEDYSELIGAKNRVLEFMVNTPEILYGHDTDTIGFNQIGPGYLPCPDNVKGSDVAAPVVGSSLVSIITAADGSSSWGSCLTGAGVDESASSYVPVLWGLLPREVIDHSGNAMFLIGQGKRFFYFVDQRYVIPNGEYSQINRNLNPATMSASAIGPGAITLNGDANYVALIVDPGSDNQLNEFKVSSISAYAYQFSYDVGSIGEEASDPTIDKVIGIQYSEEWLALVGRRVCRERARLSAYNDASGNPIEVADNQASDSWFYLAGNVSSWYSWSVGCP